MIMPSPVLPHVDLLPNSINACWSLSLDAGDDVLASMDSVCRSCDSGEVHPTPEPAGNRRVLQHELNHCVDVGLTERQDLCSFTWVHGC
jgi:hypothetical protein